MKNKNIYELIIIVTTVIMLSSCVCKSECSDLACQKDYAPFHQVIGYGDVIERHGAKAKHNRLVRKPVFQCICLPMIYETDEAKRYKENY